MIAHNAVYSIQCSSNPEADDNDILARVFTPLQ